MLISVIQSEPYENLFPHMEIDYTKYCNLNDIPRREDDIDVCADTLPNFIMNILKATDISENCIINFIRKFVITYLSDFNFRILTYNCVFLILESEYIGVYTSLEQALEVGYKLREESGEHLMIYTPRMFTRKAYGYKF